MALLPWIRHGPKVCKKILLGVLFFVLFMVSDGSSAASHAWEGAPPSYWPIGLSVAVLLSGGFVYAPLILFSGVVAALLNYHRPLFSWCGLPGVTAIYCCSFAAVALLRKHVRIDPALSRLRDVGRYILVLLLAEIASGVFGMLTLWGDGLVDRSQRVAVVVDWWASDAIALLTFAPFLLIHVLPVVESWLNSEVEFFHAIRQRSWPRTEVLEMATQALSVIGAIWLIFGCEAVVPYQPLYLLFIPVIWVAVRRGLPGAALTVFGINIGLTSAAWLTQAAPGSMPRLQLAILVLGLTGLCLGAVVSEGKRAQQELRQSEAGLYEAQRVARLGRWTYDPRTEQITWSEEVFHMWGLDPSLPPPRFGELSRFFAPESWQRLRSQIQDTLRSGNPYELELETLRPDGSRGWMMARGRPQRNARGEITGLFGIAQDITERKHAESKIQSLAYSDALTGLPNRVLYQDRLSQAIAAAKRRGDRLAVLYLDLDRFKSINDSLGHATGDLLLQEAAERLKRQIREQDTVARIGGDEFVILLSAIQTIDHAATAAERIVSAFSQAFVIQGRSLKISCSIGIGVFPDHGTDGETLVKNADAALYGAKEGGRNRFCFFSDEMNTQVLERSVLEQGLRMALDEKEFFLMYQPQIEISSGKVAGLEALVRWSSPEFGLVPPDRFIKVAENSGLIIPLGEWVLETACAQIQLWRQQGLLPVPVAVNVSALQFRQEGFRDLIRRVLAKTGIQPDCLELELTESLLTTNADIMFSIMKDLKDMGLKLAIDDFGTGYSSLSYLRQFPVSKLKIDRSFIRDVTTSADAASVAVAIISLAKSLNLKVIAEGVEEEAELEFLRAHGCDEAQGYYFSRPLAVEDAANYMRKAAPLTLSAAARS